VCPSPITLSFNKTYYQNFESLQLSGKDIPFPSYDGALEAWWVLKGVYSATNGETNEGGIYSYGIQSQNAISQKSLGSLTSNQMKRTSWGVSFMLDPNYSMTNLYGLNVSFIGEQWSAFNGDSSNTTRSILFDYSVVSFDDYCENWQKDDLTFGKWTSKDSLSFTTPIDAPSSSLQSGPVRTQSLSHLIAIDNWEASKVVQLRWSHSKEEGKDVHLSISDFSVQLFQLRIEDHPTPSYTSSTSSSPNISDSKSISAATLISLFIFGIIAATISVLIALFIKYRIQKRKNEYKPLITELDRMEQVPFNNNSETSASKVPQFYQQFVEGVNNPIPNLYSNRNIEQEESNNNHNPASNCNDETCKSCGQTVP